MPVMAEYAACQKRNLLWTAWATLGIIGCWVSRTCINPASGNLWLSFWVSWRIQMTKRKNKTSSILYRMALSAVLLELWKCQPTQVACSWLNLNVSSNGSDVLVWALNNLNTSKDTLPYLVPCPFFCISVFRSWCSSLSSFFSLFFKLFIL